MCGYLMTKGKCHSKYFGLFVDVEKPATIPRESNTNESITSTSLEEHNISANDKQVLYKAHTGTITLYFDPDDNPGVVVPHHGKALI